MEPVWEWQWAYWDEARGCIEVTPVWMTVDEARADWYVYDDPRSQRLDDTRRDRNRHDGPLVEAPRATLTGRASVASARNAAPMACPPS